jgi:hypothetical protein
MTRSDFANGRYRRSINDLPDTKNRARCVGGANVAGFAEATRERLGNGALSRSVSGGDDAPQTTIPR